MHRVADGIVQDQPEMIKPDNRAERFGYAGEETSQVSSAGNRA